MVYLVLRRFYKKHPIIIPVESLAKAHELGDNSTKDHGADWYEVIEEMNDYFIQNLMNDVWGWQ